MKESATSLRWYFGVIGIYYLLAVGSLTLLFGSAGLLGTVVGVAAGSLFFMVDIAINTLLAIINIYLAFALPKYLHPGKARPVQVYLIIELVWSIVASLEFDIQKIASLVINIVIAAAITWYLYHNVTRIAKTAQA